ncbi:MAG: LL-diaminopimelate aminotransferase [Thermodesulfobacteriota bacterium]
MWSDRLARRLKQLPPYLFAEIDKLKSELVAKGADVIDLGVGDPDLPTPPHIVEALRRSAQDPANHRYPSYSGMGDFKVSVSRWYKKRFDVELDPEAEVVSLIGSKEGIAHIPLAFVDPGEPVILPDPGYPVYQAGTVFAGGVPHFVPLRAYRGFLPDLSEIPEDVAQKAKLLFLNYPNNPTAATAEVDFFEEVVAWAKQYEVMVCHDAAYTEIAYDGYRAPSIFQVEGAKDVAIEFHSLSKTYNMTGWRVGFAVGNREIVAGLGRIKTNVDSGVFQAVQWAAMAALDGSQDCVEENKRIYEQRRDVLVEGLRRAGLEVRPPKATFYVWVKVPQGYTSKDFAGHLLKGVAIVATPGVGFGPHGEGYVRMTLCAPVERIQEAVERMVKLGF